MKENDLETERYFALCLMSPVSRSTILVHLDSWCALLFSPSPPSHLAPLLWHFLVSSPGLDGCYGTDQIPLTPQFLLAAFRFSPSGSEEIWSAQTAAAPAATISTPATFIPHSDLIGSAQQDSRADVRLQAHLHAHPATIIPEEDDDDLLDAPPEIDTPVSTAVSSALIHLERAIDNMHSASPTHPSFDPLFYLALSSLPLTYPWPILTIDLKSFLPLMDRHVLTHLVAAQASINPKCQHPAPVLCNFFKDLAHAVVHTILAPLNSQFMRPNLPPRVFTAEFWHAHLNYAALRTDPALAAIGSMDGLAGDQICQWNSVAPDSILPATRLSLFVPPPLGAFVLANHQSHDDFKSTPALDVVTDVSEIPHVSMQENVGNFQNMRKECQIKTFDGLGPFSYVCRMISFEPNTTETHTSEACVNFEDLESDFESCGPQFETSEMSLTEKFIEHRHYVCAIDEVSHEHFRGFILCRICATHTHQKNHSQQGVYTIHSHAVP